MLTVGFVMVLIGLVLGRLRCGVPLSVVLTLGLIAATRYPKRGIVAIVAVALFGLSVGVWRGAAFMNTMDPYGDLYGEQVVIVATAQEDAVYGYNSQLLFDASSLRFTFEDGDLALPGRIRVSGYGENMIFKGDRVQISGKLRAMRGGRQGQMSYAELHTIERGGTVIDSARRKFSAGMQSALPEPLASFALGLLTGQRSTLPEQTTNDLSTVGLTHIVAVSGYNLTIIVLFVQRLLAKRSKYQTVIGALVCMVLFLAVTGMNAAIVRASIVSSLSLAAWYYGRTFKPLLLISMVAAGTALWSPLYVWGDLSWYLSFLAFFGVLVIGPLLTRRIFGSREPKLIAQTLLETISAQVMTDPLVLFVFQQASLVAIVSNMVVVPLIPLAMLLSLVAGLAGALLTMTVGWFAWPARILLTYILDMSSGLAKVPHALVHYSVSLAGMVLLYAVVLLVILTLKRADVRRRQAGTCEMLNAK